MGEGASRPPFAGYNPQGRGLQRDGSIKRPKIGILMYLCGVYLLQEKIVKFIFAFQQPNKLVKRC